MDSPNVNQSVPAAADALTIPVKRGFTGFVAAHSRAVEFLFAFAFLFGRMVSLGGDYFYRAAEIATYHNYPAYFAAHSSSLLSYIREAGLLSSRPMAGIFDVFLWSKFFGSMTVAVALLSLLFAAGAVLLRGVFEKLFGTGYLFTAILCLSPAALDGLYLVGNSTRIVPAFFFAALAVFFAFRMKETSRIRFAPLFMVTHMTCFFFHEGIAFAAMVPMLYIILHTRDKKSITALLVAANFSMYALLTMMASLVWNPGDAATASYAADTVSEVGSASAFAAWSPVEFARQIGRGAVCIVRDGTYVFAGVAVLLTVCVILLARRKKTAARTARGVLAAVSIGAAMTGIQVVCAFAYAGAGAVTVADLVPCLCGAALVIDAVAGALSRTRGAVYMTILALFTVAACVGSVSEMHDYRETFIYDRECANEVIELLREPMESGEITSGTAVAILNVDVNAPDATPYTHSGQRVPAMLDHRLFSELVRAAADDPDFPEVTPIAVDAGNYFYRTAESAFLRIENYDRLYVRRDGEIIPVTYARGFTENEYDPRANYDSYLLYTDDFMRIAHVNEYSTYGIFEFY